jgi:hypothetical protein
MTHLDPDALEAAARAMIDISALGPWYRLDTPEKIAALDQARAAVTAYLAAELEQGRAMMPRKATEEMTSHGFKARDELQGKSFPRAKLPDAMWTAMFDAAPPALAARERHMTVSPELIAKLNALASRLTEQGEYEAVDLIDTVVARLTPALAQDPRP